MFKAKTYTAALAVLLASAGAAAAGTAPAPLLGAGPVGLAILAIGGGGYLTLRALRRRR